MAQLRAAEATVSLAETEFQRATALRESGNVPQSQLDRAVADLERAKAEIQNLKNENKLLKEDMVRSREEVDVLRKRLRDSFELQDAMQTEITSLKTTIQWYEKRLREVDGIGSGSAEVIT